MAGTVDFDSGAGGGALSETVHVEEGVVGGRGHPDRLHEHRRANIGGAAAGLEELKGAGQHRFLGISEERRGLIFTATIRGHPVEVAPLIGAVEQLEGDGKKSFSQNSKELDPTGLPAVSVPTSAVSICGRRALMTSSLAEAVDLEVMKATRSRAIRSSTLEKS